MARRNTQNLVWLAPILLGLSLALGVAAVMAGAPAEVDRTRAADLPMADSWLAFPANTTPPELAVLLTGETSAMGTVAILGMMDGPEI